MIITWIYRIVIGLTIGVSLYYIFPNTEPNPRPTDWELNVNHQPLTILGLTLGKSQLKDMILRANITPEIALFTTRQRQGEPEPPMHLEAYFEDVFDEGDRVIVNLEADLKFLQHLKKQAYQPQLFPDGVIRTGVREEHLLRISNSTIHSITIIAGEAIDFELFKSKYKKTERAISDGQGNAHFLFPHLGLDFIQPNDGLQILQFVSPSLFDKELLQPLEKTIAERPS